MIRILPILCFSLFIVAETASGQSAAPTVLRDLAADNAAWKGKTVTMVLRLRNIDPVFERIIFYDDNGHDIEFDLSSRAERKRLRPDLANSHEGMRYRVTLVVGAPGRLELVSGTLRGFVPIIIDAIPERPRPPRETEKKVQPEDTNSKPVRPDEPAKKQQGAKNPAK